jgi:hypothetical protein
VNKELDVNVVQAGEDHVARVDLAVVGPKGQSPGLYI